VTTIHLAPGTFPGFISLLGDTVAFEVGYNGTVSRIDLLHDSVTATGPQVVAFPGGIACVGGSVYVSDYGSYLTPGKTVVVVDPAHLTAIDTLPVGSRPGMLTSDGGSMLYLSCLESSFERGRIYSISSSTRMVTDSILVGGGPSDLRVRNGALFVLHGGRVWKLGVHPLTIQDSSFITMTAGINYYSMGMDPANGDLYVSRIIGSGGNGMLDIYSSDGRLLHASLGVGIFPGAYAFKE